MERQTDTNRGLRSKVRNAVKNLDSGTRAGLLSGLVGLGLGLTIVQYLEQKPEDTAIRSAIPRPRDNQALVLHPDYLNGTSAIGYTLLTDVDRNGDWDVAERYYAGFTSGDGSHKLYFKKGFGPAQHVNTEIEFVEPEFFKPYQ